MPTGVLTHRTSPSGKASARRSIWTTACRSPYLRGPGVRSTSMSGMGTPSLSWSLLRTNVSQLRFPSCIATSFAVVVQARVRFFDDLLHVGHADARGDGMDLLVGQPERADGVAVDQD